jgi:hypothetical protein
MNIDRQAKWCSSGTLLDSAIVIFAISAVLVACGGHADGPSIEQTWRGFVKAVNATYRASAGERSRLISRAVGYLSADGCRFVIAANQVAITAQKPAPCDEALSGETALDGYQPSVRDVRISGSTARAITKGGEVRFDKQDGKWLISRFPTVGD